MKLQQIEQICCKFEIVAANFQNELMQIKTSKVCMRTEGMRSGDFYILGQEAFILFSWPG